MRPLNQAAKLVRQHTLPPPSNAPQPQACSSAVANCARLNRRAQAFSSHHISLPGHRAIRTEVISLDQWYKRSLRFRSAHGIGSAAGGGRQQAQQQAQLRRPHAQPPLPQPDAASGGGSLAGGGLAAGKRPALWPPTIEDARGVADQQHQGKRAATDAAVGQGMAAGAGPAAPQPSPAAVGPSLTQTAQPCKQQQQQRQPLRPRQQHAAGPSGAGAAAPSPAAGARAVARHAVFTPLQLQAKTAKELAEMLKARGQSGAGRKEQLVMRLLDFQRRMRRAMQPA
jgi:hypothetical protein